jgi:hypothetical protein
MLRNFLIICSCIFFFFSCDEKFNCKDFKLGSPIIVKAGILYQDCHGRLFITLLRVENDSRCPSNANCVWEGNAEVVFTFRNGSDVEEFTLDTNKSMPDRENQKLILGHLIELHSLHPYPEAAFEINHKDYIAEITITEVIFD